MVKKSKYILIIIMMMLLVIVAGTFAWLSYRSENTAMVLTIGDIKKVSVTLSPYRIKETLIPKLTYKEDNDDVDKYTSVTAINHLNYHNKISLYYQINNIDSELISHDFKYTIEKEINGVYEEYKTGDFSDIEDNKLVILEENMSENTTNQYRVYIWLEDNGNQSNIQGKSFDGELRAEITGNEYAYQYEYTGDYQLFTAPVNGYYKIRTWGAQGGYRSNTIYGGKGGFSSGFINLNAGEQLYVYVGGSGNVGGTNGGFNGGGARGAYFGGGGATDIRYFKDTIPTDDDLVWNSELGLNSRIMVAAGGGSDGASNKPGKAGGGLIGLSATESCGSGGAGATQIIGNAFGIGGLGKSQSNGHAGSGGGGYYGGYGSTPDGSGDDDRGGGGGSSYISGYAGVFSKVLTIYDINNNTIIKSDVEGIIKKDLENIIKDSEYSMSTAGELIVTLSGRNYYKVMSEPALAGYHYDGSYTGAVLVGLTPDSVKISTSYSSTILSYSGSLIYHGITFYYGSWEYQMSGNHNDTSGKGRIKLNNTALNLAALELLEKTGIADIYVTETETIHNSNKYFINSEMQTGVNSGNGKAVIEYIGDTLEKTNTKLNDVRYIKDCMNGSSANTTNHWVEFQAIKDGLNVAKGKTVTGITNNTTYPITRITDGDINSANYAQGSTGLQCITVDLEDTYDLDEIAVWHYYSDGRTYKENVTSVSSDNENWTEVIANNDAESSNGKRVNAWEGYATSDSDTNTNTTNYVYTGSYQIFTAPETGYYKVETWGAQGGNANTTYVGGKGGYASGNIYLNKNDNLYVYVGGKGNVTSTAANQTAVGGYNGGGSGKNFSSSNRLMASGGGATDIRYFGSNTPIDTELTCNSELGLNSRIIVASGGSGASYYNASYYSPGSAGGMLIAPTNYGRQNGVENTALGATQTSPLFGQGGNAAGLERPGGGAGYYGGISAYYVSSGGSSFISGYAGVNAITSASDRTHTNDTRHYSELYFLNGKMQAGVNTGNGKVKITYVGNTIARASNRLDNVRYIKDCINGSNKSNTNQWVELQAIKDGLNVAKGKSVTGINEYDSFPLSRITDGDITSSSFAQGTTSIGNQCITVDLENTYDLDELAVWHLWSDGRTYKDNVTSVSSDGVNFSQVIANNNAESVNGKRYNTFYYFK